MSNIPYIKDKVIGLLDSECSRNNEGTSDNVTSFILCQKEAFDAKLLIDVFDNKRFDRLYISFKLDLTQLYYLNNWIKSFVLCDWLLNPASSFSTKPINKILQRRSDILDFFTCCYFVVNPYNPVLGYTESTLTFNGDFHTTIKRLSLSFETRAVFVNDSKISIEDFVSLNDIICNDYKISYENLREISIRSQSYISECLARRREEEEKKRSKKKK